MQRMSWRLLFALFVCVGASALPVTAQNNQAVDLETVDTRAILLFVPIGVRVAAGLSIPLGHATFRRGCL
jgi:hypothetical protein